MVEGHPARWNNTFHQFAHHLPVQVAPLAPLRNTPDDTVSQLLPCWRIRISKDHQEFIERAYPHRLIQIRFTLITGLEAYTQ